MKKIIPALIMTLTLISCDESIVLDAALDLENGIIPPQTIECPVVQLGLWGNSINSQGSYGTCTMVYNELTEDYDAFYTPDDANFNGVDFCMSSGGSDIEIDYTNVGSPVCEVKTYTL